MIINDDNKNKDNYNKDTKIILKSGIRIRKVTKLIKKR